MQLFPEFTFVGISFALFIFTYMVIGRMIVRPVLGVMKKRETDIFGAEAQAKATQQEAASVRDHYQAKIQELRQKGTALRAEQRTQAMKQQAGIISEAKEQLQVQANEQRAIEVDDDSSGRPEPLAVEDEIEKIKRVLSSQTQSFARQVAGRILGRAE